MHKALGYIVGSFLLLAWYACGSAAAPAGSRLSATEFAAKRKELPAATLLDVRTAAEFTGGHLQGALNADWNAADFNEKVAGLDKEQPLMVYCLSGGRSGEAAAWLRKAGFKQVYEMQGGLMQWKAAGLELESGKAADDAGMSVAVFEKQLTSNGQTLVHFSAEWCVPCRRMEPVLEELKHKRGAGLHMLKVDVEKNPALTAHYQVQGVPVFMLFVNGKQVWSEAGAQSLPQLEEVLDRYK